MIRKEIKDDFQNADLISSQSRYDRFDTPAYIFWHRPAQRLEKCEISMQDNDEKLGTWYPIKPAVMGFPADKVTCRMQTFESISLLPFRYICLFGFYRFALPAQVQPCSVGERTNYTKERSVCQFFRSRAYLQSFLMAQMISTMGRM